MTSAHRSGESILTAGTHIGTGVHDDTGYQRVRARLTERTDACLRRTAERLETARLANEIDERSLMRTHREVGRQVASGLAPSAAEFWRSSAGPRAERLSDTAKAVIDDEMDAFADSAVRFRRSVRLLGTGDPTTIDRAEHDLHDQLLRLSTLAIDRGPLDDLGTRFERRIRRAATMRLGARTFLLSPAETERTIDRIELELLELPPYSHCDKLLVAFELAHADVRAHVRTRVRAMMVRSSRRMLSEVPARG